MLLTSPRWQAWHQTHSTHKHSIQFHGRGFNEGLQRRVKIINHHIHSVTDDWSLWLDATAAAITSNRLPPCGTWLHRDVSSLRHQTIPSILVDRQQQERPQKRKANDSEGFAFSGALLLRRHFCCVICNVCDCMHVFLTLQTVSTSQGRMVCRSMSSQDTPSFS